MLNKLRFYLSYSINDLGATKRQTLFAMLCIAVGVAAIVSLQTLGMMIKDTFSGNLQESNLADIRVLPQPRVAVSGEIAREGQTRGMISPQNLFRMTGVYQVQNWLDERYPGQITLTYRQALETNSGLLVTNLRTGILDPLTIPYIVDAKTYPLYGTVRSEDGRALRDLIRDSTDIVISRNLADQLKAEVGDTLRLNDAGVDFTVRGIVPAEVRGSLDAFKIAAGVLGFYYLDLEAVSHFQQMTPRADIIFLRLKDPAQTARINRELLEAFPFLSTVTTTDLASQNSRISDIIGKVVSTMGLVSMLIGGIGIVNTMLVVVRRRTEEIAVLKTIGLEPGEVTQLFLIEAMIIGVLGSLVGVVLGWVFVYAARDLAGSFLAHPLDLRLSPGPAITGFVVGVLVTVVFGFLPTITAGQVRPGLVLHPRDEIVPPAARMRLFVTLIGTMLALSAVAQGMIGDLPVEGGALRMASGVIGLLFGVLIGWPMTIHKIRTNQIRCVRRSLYARCVFRLAGLPALGFLFGYGFPAILILFSVFLLVGVLYVLLWAIIWLIGRLAALRVVFELKFVFRSLSVTRGRNASTLLALVVGVFALSLTTLLVHALRERLVEQLIQETGGNVIVYLVGANNTLPQVERTLAENYSADRYAVVKRYKFRLIAVEESGTGNTWTISELEQRLAEAAKNDTQWINELRTTLEMIDARQVNTNLPDFRFYSGRQLNAEDAGQPVIVISVNEATLAAGLNVGDRLIYQLSTTRGQEIPDTLTVEIVGMADRRNSIVSGLSAPNYVPLGLIPHNQTPSEIRIIMSIRNAELIPLRELLSNIPGTFVLETKSLNDLLNRVIDQLSAFLVPMAGLALFTGGVVIANSVALSTMERRRDIATMKAVGLGRWRVLAMLLVEYGLMGLIGGLIGLSIGVTILGGLLAMFFQGDPGHAVPYITVVLLLIMCVGIALVAALLSAWGASGEKPLNVLRYK